MPESIGEIDWSGLFSFACKQAIAGVLFDGVNRLPKEMVPPRELLMKWFAMSEQIRKRNMQLNADAVEVYNMFRSAGFRCCVLKGQGNAMMYDNRFARTPGDIDLWVNADRKAIMNYVGKNFGVRGLRYHHVELDMKGATDVEVHFFPLNMNNPINNSRLQKWFGRVGDLQCSNVVELPDGVGKMAVPTNEFNRVYQLAHIFHHFFDEGIGLRQLMDYYYLLNDMQSSANDEYVIALLKRFGLYKFARAVMYVEQRVFGLDDRQMYVEPDAKAGEMLLEEILNGGNFGRYYTKYGEFTKQSTAKKYFLKVYRNLHFIKEYPAEALSEPIFRTWHFFWRLRQ